MRFGKLHALHRYHIFSMIPDVKTYPGQPRILDYLCNHEYCTQAELARRSNVSLRSIQMYEQRNKDINKASAATVLSLAKVLGCTMEDLLEK